MDLQPLLTERFDSALPTGVSTLVHPFARPGRWQLEACSGDEVRARFSLSVADAGGKDAGEPVVALDAGELAAGQLHARWSLAATGLNGVVGGVLQIVGGQARRRSLDAIRLVDGHHHPVWSSAALDEGDLFALVPLRPGNYAVRDLGTGQRGALRVHYPDPRQPLPELPPLRPDAAFDAAMELTCGQGLVLTARQGSRFVVELEQADDGASELREWQARHDRALWARMGRRG